MTEATKPKPIKRTMRTYEFLASDLTYCRQCGGLCAPFPHRGSLECSNCYHLNYESRYNQGGGKS
jgi:protein-arginine kinase activator protein McsA